MWCFQSLPSNITTASIHVDQHLTKSRKTLGNFGERRSIKRKICQPTDSRSGGSNCLFFPSLYRLEFMELKAQLLFVKNTSKQQNVSPSEALAPEPNPLGAGSPMYGPLIAKRHHAPSCVVNQPSRTANDDRAFAPRALQTLAYDIARVRASAQEGDGGV